MSARETVETLSAKRIEVVRGVSSKTGRDYIRLDLVFDVGGRDYRTGLFLNYQDVFILGLNRKEKD